jgi:hypothetical protein
VEYLNKPIDHNPLEPTRRPDNTNHTIGSFESIYANMENGNMTNPPPPAAESGLGAEFTQHVIDSMGPKTDPRFRKVMGSLIKHMHDFARDVDLTVDEWMKGVELINWAGKMSDMKRNEGQLVCDVLGLESYVPSCFAHQNWLR